MDKPMIKLKPCPFCGNNINKISYEENRLYETYCSSCKTRFIHQSTSQYDAESEWNKRVDTSKVVR